MATFLFTQYRTPHPRARARARGVRCAAWPTPDKRMLSWKSNWSPLWGHLRFQGNMATFLVCAVHNYNPCARARTRGVRCAIRQTSESDVILETHSVTAKGPLQFPGQHGDFSILRNTELPTRARVERAAFAAPPGRHLKTLRITRVNFDFQSATATGPLEFPDQIGDTPSLRNTRLPTRERARACSARCAAWPTSDKRILTCKSNRPPLRGHFRFQGIMATVLVCAMQNSPPTRARAAYAAPPGRHLKQVHVNLETQWGAAKGNFSAQGNIASFLFCTVQTSPPARTSYARRTPRRLADTWPTHFNLATQSATDKGPLEFPGQHGD